MLAVQGSSDHWVREKGRNTGILLTEPYRQRPRDLKKIFHKNGRGEFSSKKIILPGPIDLPNDSHLLLSCKWDFTTNDLEFRIRCGFLSKTIGDKYHFSGFRYETPEGVGEHNYYHAQPINSFEKTDNTSDHEDVENSPHAPTRLPTFPLVVKSPFELFACSLKSIYSREEIDKLFFVKIRHEQTKKALREYLDSFN